MTSSWRGALAAATLVIGVPADGPAQQSDRPWIYLEPPRTASMAEGFRIAHDDAPALVGVEVTTAGHPLPPQLLHTPADGARTGTLPVLVLLTRFSDSAQPTVDAGAVHERLFGDAAESLPSYYEEQSGGVFTVVGEATPWVQTEITLFEGAGSHNGHGLIGARLAEHILAALTQVDHAVDFRQYDNDGPDGIPNSGDDDGYVDALAVKFPEIAGSCGGPGPWPHYSGFFVEGEARPFESDDTGARGDPIRVHRYVIDSATECDGSAQGIGPLAHELGHNLGLPDYYVAANGIEPEHRRWFVGCFDLMGAGSWGCGDPTVRTVGFGPTGLSAFSRWRLGWAELQAIDAADNETFVLDPLNVSHRGLRVRLSPLGDEWWVFEYRTRTGYDTDLPAAGVLIYHVATDRARQVRFPDQPPAYRYQLVEADGDAALQKVAAQGGNRGVASDVFATNGPAGPYGYTTTPSTREFPGGASTLDVHRIQVEGGQATIRLSTGQGFRVVWKDVPALTEVLEPISAEIIFDGGDPPYTLTDFTSVGSTFEAELSGSTLAIRGTPDVVGLFPFAAAVRDASGRVIVSQEVIFAEDIHDIDPELILRQIIDGSAFPDEYSGYLDRSGNGDQELDIGDLRAFLLRNRP